MRVFITGVNGQLGQDVLREVLKRNYVAIGADISNCEYNNFSIYDNSLYTFLKLDITDRDSVVENIEKSNPDIVIHCAAWTAVDAAEDSNNTNKVWDINVNGTKNIAEACKKVDCKMIYISTDYVFNGVGQIPWRPDSFDFNPLNYYGHTKLEGEFEVTRRLEKYFIVRISWVFGIYGNNFVKTIIKLGKTRNKISVVNDQIGNPTYCEDLARLLLDMSETNKYGYYHVSNEGDFISWYDFTIEIFKQSGISTEVIPVTTKEYGASKAPRPLNSRLDRRKIKEVGFKPLPSWKDALSRFLKEVQF